MQSNLSMRYLALAGILTRASINTASLADTASAPHTTSAAGKVETPLYTVVDGNRVDAKTLQGFRTWRAAACDRCHGANQEGLVGPSLIDALKTLTPKEFKKTVTDGRMPAGMPSFKASTRVMSNLDNLYDYLKGRSDGAIKQAKVVPME